MVHKFKVPGSRMTGAFHAVDPVNPVSFFFRQEQRDFGELRSIHFPHPVRPVRRFSRRDAEAQSFFPFRFLLEFLIQKFISGTHELRERCRGHRPRLQQGFMVKNGLKCSKTIKNDQKPPKTAQKRSKMAKITQKLRCSE